MKKKEIYSQLGHQSPKGYRINELTKISYPVRKIRIKAVVNKAPDENLVKVYNILLRSIDQKFNEKKLLFDFLGIAQTDEFILRELFSLREKGLLDLLSDNKWYVTEEGKAFIKDNSFLRVEEREDYDFLMDGLTGGVFSAALNPNYKEGTAEKYIERELNVPMKSSELLKDKYQQLCNLYQQDSYGKANLIDYDESSILYDNNRLWIDYWLVGYVPQDGSGDPYYEIRRDVESLDKDELLSKRFNDNSGQYVSRLVDSDTKEEDSESLPAIEETNTSAWKKIKTFEPKPKTGGSYIRYQNKSLNLNAVDVIESDSTTGENWLSPNREDPKRAVIELSTKAVKWLIPKVDNETIRKSFSFDHFIPQAVKTETGNGLDKDKVMNMAYFKKKVMPTIRRAAREVKDNKVDVVHCVASAVYRGAKNRQEILDLIKSETGLEVCVLSEDQEAEYTLWGYLCADNSGEIKNVPNVLLIDMGGGSTEVTLFQNQKKTFRYPFNVGTTALKNDFLGQDKGSVAERLAIIDKKYQNQLAEKLFDAEIPEIKGKTLCICVGTPVTAALGSGAKKNRCVHNQLLTMDAIKESIQNRTEELSAKSIEEIVEILNEKGEAAQTFEKRLSSRLGLPLVATIIRAFHVHELRISGVGLWYGVYYKNFWNIE